MGFNILFIFCSFDAIILVHNSVLLLIFSNFLFDPVTIGGNISEDAWEVLPGASVTERHDTYQHTIDR